MRRQAIVAALVCLVVVGATVSTDTAPPPAQVSVMTRNLYLGADITRPVRAATDRRGTEALLALGHANHALRAQVDRTDFAVRSRLLAAEIVATRPDLVGLQEVALWRHGPLDLARPGALDAASVDLDFLAMLQAELGRQGAAYEVASVQVESDVEAPSFLGDPSADPATGGEDVRFTDRDVILVRADAGLVITGSGGGTYARRLEVPLAGSTYGFTRGYAWADITTGSSRLRFVTTHLESQSSALALAQLAELLTGPALPRSATVVLTGDFNADPASRPYALVTGRGRFLDTGTGLGATGTLGEGVDDPTAAALRRRIDLVLVRPGPFGSVRTTSARLVGNVPDVRDPATGLWPSDHAGVVVRLALLP